MSIPAPEEGSAMLSGAGAPLFSPDGKSLAGSFLLPDPEGTYYLSYYTADLAAGEVRILRREALSPL